MTAILGEWIPLRRPPAPNSCAFFNGLLARGRVRFRNTAGTRLLVDQLRDFPLGDYDDGSDAMELAIGRLERISKTPFPRKK
jgi:hypothetical protein